MRFSYAESMTDPSFYAPLARAAEAAGYDSMVVPDSICYPQESVSVYPFNPDGTREFLEDKPFLEPFSLIPALGAVTERLRFVTFVLKLPDAQPGAGGQSRSPRWPVLLAGGRLVLGVGTSPWREDYEVLGVPWGRRGQRMDEALANVRGLAAAWLLRVPRRAARPAAGQDLAGAGRAGAGADRRARRGAALRRAAFDGDGWLHGGGDTTADLPGLLARAGRAAPLRRAPRTARSRCT